MTTYDKGGCPIKEYTLDVYEVPHRDFVSFTRRRTTLVVNFERDDEEKVAYVPLLTVTSVETVPTEAASGEAARVSLVREGSWSW